MKTPYKIDFLGYFFLRRNRNSIAIEKRPSSHTNTFKNH